jgi:transketolase
MKISKKLAELRISENLLKDDLVFLKKVANTIRTLSMDAVQKANSGHPGMPMGMADAATVLWTRHLKFNPEDPNWPDRDRFVLSAGHGSMLLYSLLHLTGFDLPLSELQSFRQWESKTPGHPEYGHTPGVETTTGPLGQGISNAVGFAIAEKHHSKAYNKSDSKIVGHYTFVIASDGDMMEGVSHEACALAGHLGIGKLIVLYDDNHISIDGSTELAFSENVLTRFKAYKWHTQAVDGHDMEAVDRAISEAKAEERYPSIIRCTTTIGYGSPNLANTAKAHGSPLGVDEIKLTKKELHWPEDAHFFIPDDVLEFMRESVTVGKENQLQWEQKLSDYKNKYPELGQQFENSINGILPEKWSVDLPSFPEDSAIATRSASGEVLNAISPRISQLIGGSADLTPSNNTLPKNEKPITRDDFSGRYIHFGVREHGMGAILSGLAIHGGFIPYGGTFLVFSDYMRGSIRLAALMNAKVIYVFTHDSIGLGEDGPTHQPVEHFAALRAIPNLVVIRPADATETVEAWKAALTMVDGPVALMLTRQKLPVLDRKGMNFAPSENALRGGYVLCEDDSPQSILMATGSEVHIALKAKELLNHEGVRCRVVSMPSFELFENQPEEYKMIVLPKSIPARAAIEAGVTLSWYKYVGDYGEIVGIERFGASAPHKDIYNGFHVTPEALVEAIKRSIKNVNNHRA